MAEKREYTLHKHILRVRRCMEHVMWEGAEEKRWRDGMFCPASCNFDWNRNQNDRWTNDPCKVCSGFVGLISGCPCMQLGRSLAYRETCNSLHLAGYPVRNRREESD